MMMTITVITVLVEFYSQETDLKMIFNMKTWQKCTMNTSVRVNVELSAFIILPLTEKDTAAGCFITLTELLQNSES